MNCKGNRNKYHICINGGCVLGVKTKRNKNNLADLAINFIDLIKRDNEKVFQIDDIVRKLNISKRRIYDITNVLEGIGIIRKLEKNKIEFSSKKFIDDHQIQDDFSKDLSTDFIIENELKNEEKHLDNWINELKNSNSQKLYSEGYKNNLYLNYNHLKSLARGEDINLLGISAPNKTRIIIPESESIEKLYKHKFNGYQNIIKPNEKDLQLHNFLANKHQIFLENFNETSLNQDKREIKIFIILSSNTNENKFK